MSAHSSDQSYFRLGMMESEPSKEALNARGVLLTYVQDQGQPKISQLTCSLGPREVTLKMEGKKYFYRTDPTAHYRNLQDVPNRLSKWASAHEHGKPDFKEFEPPKFFGGQETPLAFLLSFASSISEVKGKKKQSFQFLRTSVWSTAYMDRTDPNSSAKNL